MSIFKAVLRAAVSFALLSGCIAALVTAQTPPAQPAQASEKRPKAPPRRPRNHQQEEIKREIRELKQVQEEIRKELVEIKQLLLARQPPAKNGPPEKISIASRPVRGSDTARVVVVEFSDYQCPYCALFFRQTLPQLDQNYIQTGKVRYVFNNVPLDQIHPAAFKAAEAAECAKDQGKFWEMHDKIFSNQRTMSVNDLSAHAKAIGLDLSQFSQCLDQGKNSPAVKAGLALAEQVGVDGTPTFVIALADTRNPKDTDVKVVGIISGAQPFSVFKSALDKALATQ